MQTFLLTIGETTHNCNLETKKVTIDTGDKEYRIRRHVIGEGLQGQWEMLSMKYEKPSALQGQGLLMILEKVWDYGFDHGTNLVDDYIRRIREKIDAGFEIKLLHTVRGQGYILKENA